MDMLAMAAAGIVAALCAVVVRQRTPEIAVALTAAACLLLLWNTLSPSSSLILHGSAEAMRTNAGSIFDPTFFSDMEFMTLLKRRLSFIGASASMVAAILARISSSRLPDMMASGVASITSSSAFLYSLLSAIYGIVHLLSAEGKGKYQEACCSSHFLP